jgi:UDP-N-acetylmuramate dehydrogenase
LLITENIQLKELNWFKTGGAARFFVEPVSVGEFVGALDFARTNNLDVFVLGEGANILISDAGFDGLVIKPKLNTIKILDTQRYQENSKLLEANNFITSEILVQAGAGVNFGDLIDFCLVNNILGLEEFSGIPGSVGGSVYINIHFFEFLLSQFLVSAEIIERQTGKILVVDNSWFEFGYDQSKLQTHQYYLISATFKLKLTDSLTAAFAKGRAHEIRRYRTHRYPSKNTCGSFFRNFHAHEVKLSLNNKPMIYTAYYLDKLGFKGSLQVGDAQVSYQHANMLVNLGAASSQDLIELARLMQQQVFTNFGIIPQPECLLIGFKEYPLI